VTGPSWDRHLPPLEPEREVLEDAWRDLKAVLVGKVQPLVDWLAARLTR
jgi:hypothetical protein